MMSELALIQKPIYNYLSEFNKEYETVVSSEVNLLNQMSSYINQSKGKQIRPTFTYLAALLCGQINKQTTRAALAIELLHVSTLIHDDVVDHALYRRGSMTLNHKWTAKLAVLYGDYVLSLVLRLLSDHDDFSVLKILSRVASDMSEGEILQQQKTLFSDYSETTYFEVIRKKTASLLSACFEGGGVSVGATSEQILLLKEIGVHVGMAFQIKDDILDYLPSSQTGKMRGNDIREKKYTLPLICFMKECSAGDKAEVIASFSSKEELEEGFVESLINKIQASSALEQVHVQMKAFVDLAVQKLNFFPDSEVRKSIEKTILYTTLRSA